MKLFSLMKIVYSPSSVMSTGGAGQSFDVFISFDHEQTTRGDVDRIVTNLQQKKLKVFVCNKCIQPGDPWPAEVIGAIRNCKIFVVMLTSKYVKSNYCSELFEADALGKSLFPVLLQEAWA